MADPTPKTRSGMTDPQVLTALITGIVSVVVAVVGLVPTIISANAPTATFTPPPTATYTSTFTAEPPTLTFTPEPPSPTSVPPTVEPTATTEVVVAQVVTEVVPPTNTARPLEPLVTPVPPTVEQIPPTVEQIPPTVEQIPPTVEQIAPTQVPEEAAPVVEANQPPPNVLLIYDDVSFTVVNVSGGTLSLKGIRFWSKKGEWDVRKWGGKSIYEQLPNQKCLRLRDSASGNRNPPGECKDLHALRIDGGDALFWQDVGKFEVRRRKEVLTTCKTDTDRCAVYIPQN